MMVRCLGPPGRVSSVIKRVMVPSFVSFISFHSVRLKPTPGKPLLEAKIIRPFWSNQVSVSYCWKTEK